MSVGFKETIKSIFKVICGIFCLPIAFAMLRYCYEMRYNVVPCNPYWLNLMAMVICGLFILGVLSLFLSRPLLHKICPLLIGLIILGSLPANSVNHLPLYMIKPWHYSQTLHKCLNENINQIDARITCHEQAGIKEPQSVEETFIWQYCKKYAKTGAVQGAEAERYKFFYCLYEEGYTNAG